MENYGAYLDRSLSLEMNSAFEGFWGNNCYKRMKIDHHG
jgi:hypothetical protein